MDLGQTRRGVDMGPSAIRYAGVLERLENIGYKVVDRGDIEIGRPTKCDVKNDDKNLQAWRTQKYIESIKSLKPGVTMMIMHCTATTEVFPYISDSGPLRRGDMLAMMDPSFKKALSDEHIILTTWRELMERRSKIR